MKGIKNLGLLLALIILGLGLTACTTTPLAEKAGEKEVIGEEKNTEVVSEYKSVSIKHELDNQEVVIENKPERVVVFDYGLLDALDNIGQDIVGLPKATLPNYLNKYSADKYVDVGTLKEPNFETIFELQPDLIIISSRQVDLYEDFKRIGPTVYLPLDGGDYLNSFKYNMGVLGEIFNKEDLMVEKVGEIEARIREIHEIGSKLDATSLFLMANDGSLSVYGPGSRFGFLHKEFGLAPIDPDIDSSTHGQKISYEYIAEKDPDYLFLMDRAAVAGGEVDASQIMENELIYNTKAYKNGNIIYLDPYIWYVASGGITGTETMVQEVLDALDK